MHRTNIFIFLLFVFFTPIVSHAADAKPVATVNVQYPSIVSQENNVFTLSFSLNNREGVQAGVRYGVALTSTTSQGDLVVDQNIFDESLTLLEHSTTEKQISYTAPAVLTGTYTLSIRSSTASGSLLAAASVAEVTLTATEQGIVIAPQGCSIKTTAGNGVAQGLSQGTSVQQNEFPLLTCSATNTTTSTLSATPFSVTYKGSRYGEEVNTTGGDTSAVSFAAGETKSFSVTLPKATAPGTYEVVVAFRAGAGVSSNTVSTRYSILGGMTASIQNLSLDKNMYVKGDIARLSMVWTATTSDPSQNTVQAKATPDIELSVSLVNGMGRECAQTVNQSLSRARPTPTTTIVLSITSDCTNPQVTVSLSKDGTVLDQQEFSFASPGAGMPLGKRTIVAIVAGLVLLFAVATAIKKKNHISHEGGGTMPISAVLPFIVLVALGSVLPLQTAHADWYLAGLNNDIRTTVNFTTGSLYTPNAYPIYVQAFMENLNPIGGVSHLVNLTASNNGGNVTQLIPNPPATSYNLLGGMSTGYFNINYTAPATEGQYNVDFVTGVDELTVPAHSMILYTVGQGWDDLGFPRWEGWVGTSTVAQQHETVTLRFNYNVSCSFIWYCESPYLSGTGVWRVDVSLPLGEIYGSGSNIGPAPLHPAAQYQISGVCVESHSPSIIVDPSYVCVN